MGHLVFVNDEDPFPFRLRTKENICHDLRRNQDCYDTLSIRVMDVNFYFLHTVSLKCIERVPVSRSFTTSVVNLGPLDRDPTSKDWWYDGTSLDLEVLWEGTL